MNFNQADILKKEAEILTARYFDGMTSLAEEERLRNLLRDPSLEGENLDEARAVMGFALMDPATGRRHNRSRRYYLSVAAGIAAVFAVGSIMLFGTRHSDIGMASQPRCMAYVGGQKVTDPEAVMMLVDDDLSEFSAALNETRQQVEVELSEFAAMSTDMKL